MTEERDVVVAEGSVRSAGAAPPEGETSVSRADTTVPDRRLGGQTGQRAH